MSSRITASIAGLLLFAACNHDTGPGLDTQTLAQCAGATVSPLNLAVGGYTTVDPAADSGCVAFPATTTSDSVEYLVLPQSTSATPGDSAPFQFANNSSTAVPPLAAAPGILGRRALRRATARRMDRAMHRRGRAVASAMRARPLAAAPVMRAAPPAVGSIRTFDVCANDDCTNFNYVNAKARAVGSHVAIYLDTLAPPGGLSDGDINNLETVFDGRLYPTVVSAFGAVSDVDANGLLIVLMTGAVNSLVTTADCNSEGYVAGFFDPGDLDPSATPSNHGEVFYTVVADPNGSLSCAHTLADIEQDVPPVFMHEVEHMISFGQHVLVFGGDPEDDWVDEGLAKLAEELGGRTYLPGDQNTFLSYTIDDLYDAYQYLSDPGSHFLVTVTDESFPDVGAGWLFFRYLADQFGSTITQKLVQTVHTGADNVATQTGQPFATLVARWGLANWVSDLPNFSPPSELHYSSWLLRGTYFSLHDQDPQDFPASFPLAPVAGAGSKVALSGILRAGSGYYVRTLQGPGATGAYALRLRGSGSSPFPSHMAGRVAVVRIR